MSNGKIRNNPYYTTVVAAPLKAEPLGRRIAWAARLLYFYGFLTEPEMKRVAVRIRAQIEPKTRAL